MRNVQVLGSGRGIGAFCSLLNATTIHFSFTNLGVSCRVERQGYRKMFCATNCSLLPPPPALTDVRSETCQFPQKTHFYSIIYGHQWVPSSSWAETSWASSPQAGAATARAERVKLYSPFQVGAKSHCKMFFPLLALHVVLKLNWFWLANKNRTAKLNFLRNVVNPVWKINPKIFFPSRTLWLAFVPSLPAMQPSLLPPWICWWVARLVSSCWGAEETGVGVNGSWDIMGWPWKIIYFPLLLIVSHLPALLLCSYWTPKLLCLRDIDVPSLADQCCAGLESTLDM